MIKVKSTVKINKSAIKQLDKNVQQALVQTAEIIHQDVVPLLMELMHKVIFLGHSKMAQLLHLKMQ